MNEGRSNQVLQKPRSASRPAALAAGGPHLSWQAYEPCVGEGARLDPDAILRTPGP